MVVATSDFDLELAAAAFERAWPADLAQFLPNKDAPEFGSALVELARIDLELAWSAGQQRDAEYYFKRFPMLAADAALARSVEFEVARQRRCAGLPARSQSEGNGEHTTTILHPTDPNSDASRAVQHPRGDGPVDGDATERLGNGPTEFPDVGAFFLGFQLIGELGRGAFSRVYLAREPAVANRLVAVKVTGNARTEIGALARLRHTHIAPVLSVQRQGPYETVVMPYLGATTLATVIKKLNMVPKSGQALVDCLKLDSSTQQSLGNLASKNWPDVVLTLAIKLAGGLAHSHQRGILHRDIKPANILIADDGEPLLLDFNLAQRRDANAYFGGGIGGTLPYMAPEQLQMLIGERDGIDARADVYSLGLVLYELLAGRPAYTIPTAPMPEAAHLLFTARQSPAPNVRQLVPEVASAFAAIIAKCLEVDPARRYADAQELLVDLNRQHDNLPLQFALEPSLVERGQKWCRRHPRLSSGATVAALACALLIAIGLIGWSIKHDRDRLASVENERMFRQELQAAQIALAHPAADPSAKARGLALALSAWSRAPLLPESMQKERGTLALLLARAKRQEGQMADAWAWNRMAQGLLKPYSVAAIVQAEAFRGTGAIADLKSNLTAVNSTTDHLAGLELLARGQIRNALALLANATDGDPNSLTAWYIRGIAEAQAGQHAQAASSFSTVIALDAQQAEAWHARGVARLELKQLEPARRDLDESIRLQTTPASHFDRGLIREAQRDLTGAIADFDAAVALSPESSRFRAARGRVRGKLGDVAGAAGDLDYIMTNRPPTETDWLARIAARPAGDSALALADVAACLEEYPESWQAWLAKASILSADTRSMGDAIAALNSAIDLHPGDAALLASRGVLHARSKNYPAARQDAEAALHIDDAPAITYQVAGIFALTAADRPKDRDCALNLLFKSIHRGYGLQWFNSDPELNSIRNLPEVRRLIEQARMDSEKSQSRP